MSKYLFLNLILIINSFIVCNFAQPRYYSLSGRIVHASDSTTIYPAYIEIEGSQLKAMSNSEGNYFIKNIPEGRHIIYVYDNGSKPRSDTIDFVGKNLAFEKSYMIGYIYIKPGLIKEIKDYYDKLKLSAGKRKIVEIKLDSLYLNKDSITLHSTFYNNSDYPIYLASYDKTNIVIFIETSDGKPFSTIRHINFDTFGNSDSDNLIIPPKSKYQYPAIVERLHSNVIDSYGTYNIKIEYQADPPDIRIPYLENAPEDYYKIKSTDYINKWHWRLPGKHLSENSLEFNNFNCTYNNGSMRVVVFNCNNQQQREKGILYESSIRIDNFSHNKTSHYFDTSFVSKDNEHGEGIVETEWTSDSKFFVFNTSLSGGHQPWHSPTYIYSIDEKRLISLDKVIAPVCSTFKLLPPDYIELSTLTKDIKVQKKITIKLSELLKH